MVPAKTGKRKRGRQRLPESDPSRPYDEWPWHQLNAECKRRGIRVRRNGPTANCHKTDFVSLLLQFDAATHANLLGVRGRGGAYAPDEEEAAGDSGGDNSEHVVEEESSREILEEEQEVVDLLDSAIVDHEEESSREILDEEQEVVDLLDSAIVDHVEAEVEEEFGPCGSTRGTIAGKGQRQQQIMSIQDYNSTFRLVNVLFTSYSAQFATICADAAHSGDPVATAEDACSVWSDVSVSYHSPDPVFSRLINDHEMFMGIDPSVRKRRARKALVQTWNTLFRAYTSAMDRLRQTSADDTRFYSFCGGRLDVLYLHLWLLFKPHLSSYFVPEQLPQSISNSASVSSIAPIPRQPRVVAPAKGYRNIPSAALHRTRHLVGDHLHHHQQQQQQSRHSNDTSISKSLNFADPSRNDDPVTYAQVTKLKLAVLREKKRMLCETASHERQRFRDERRRGLLGDVRDVSTTIADLQQRLQQQQQYRQIRGGIANDAAARADATVDAYIEDLERDLEFFTRQKRRLMADLESSSSSSSNGGLRVDHDLWGCESEAR